MKSIWLALLSATCLFSQFFSGGRDSRWQTLGAGALSSRPSTCTPNRDVYICNGAGCGVNGEYHYCTAPNVWTAFQTSQPADVILSGTHAARPTAATAGRVYLPTDGMSLQRDSGTSWVSWGTVLPIIAPPAVAGFTWVNQGGASATDANGSIILRAPTSAGSNARCLVTAAPTPPYTVTVALLPGLIGTNATSTGLIFRESSSGKLSACSFGFDLGRPEYCTDKWTNPSTYVGHYATVPSGTVRGPLIWLRIQDDGTQRNCFVGADGRNWILLHAVARTDFLTADMVGIYVDANTGANGYQAAAAFVHFQIQ
jgi:hypothetical protein